MSRMIAPSYAPLVNATNPNTGSAMAEKVKAKGRPREVLHAWHGHVLMPVSHLQAEDKGMSTCPCHPESSEWQPPRSRQERVVVPLHFDHGIPAELFDERP